MVINHAELRLYRGGCSSRGLTEGRFFPENRDERSRARFSEAQGIVQDAVSGMCGRVHIYLPSSFVRSLEEAESLADYAESKIAGSRRLILLEDVMHGDISFCRLIRFDGYASVQKRELVELLKNSGYIPSDIELDMDLRAIEEIRRTCGSDEKLERKWRKEIGRKRNALWYGALTFFEDGKMVRQHR